MIARLHLDPKLEKCLADLRKGSRRACLAADRVETLIAAVRRGELPRGEMATFTRNGEARIKGCRKYDLGGGYRLVTLKQGRDLYLLYAGTHDDCARWIENNRAHLPLEMIAERCRTVGRSAPVEAVAAPVAAASATDGEEDWMAPLEERDLRRVFRGLINGLSRSSGAAERDGVGRCVDHSGFRRPSS